MKKFSFLNRIVFYLTLVFFLALLAACIVPYTNSASLAFFSLAVPGLVVVNLFFVLYWVVQRKATVFLPLIVLAYGYLTFGSFIMLGNSSKSVSEENSLKIMSYNSLFFRSKEDVWGSSAGDSIVKFVIEEGPDIVSFQEFDYRKIGKQHFKSYPYRFIDHVNGMNRKGVLQAIFSKYPILDSGVLDFPNSSNKAIYSDVIYKKDTLRIYNLHLQSLSVRPRSLKKERSDRLFVRLRQSFKQQQEQSKIVREHMDSSPYKIIVSGDFNNNQFSRVYLNLRENYKDSFLEKGNGFGNTINFWRFAFRIDYILVDPSFEVLSHQNYNINLSDHEPIMASIKIPGN